MPSVRRDGELIIPANLCNGCVRVAKAITTNWKIESFCFLFFLVSHAAVRIRSITRQSARNSVLKAWNKMPFHCVSLHDFASHFSVSRFAFSVSTIC